MRKIVKPPPLNSPHPDMGAVTGDGDGLFFGRFIPGENDGRVAVDSVLFKGMKECVVVDYHHNKIHRKYDVAELVYRFLRKGTFGKEKK